MKRVEIGSINTTEGLLLVAGPCVIEGEALTLDIAGTLKEIATRLELPFVFKASYDKANRTSIESYRGPGLEQGLAILKRVKEEIGVPVLTDVHCKHDCSAVAEVCDCLQIPAYLCRQTDLLVAAGSTGRAVNIKKGQFMDPYATRHAVEKVRSTGNENILLTERGTFFGYNNLVVDMRSLVVMRGFGFPVIFDATHSVQRPSVGTASGGDRQMAPHLMRAAVGCGIDGIFIETHPDPDRALSDSQNSLRLDEVEELLSKIKELHEAKERIFGS